MKIYIPASFFSFASHIGVTLWHRAKACTASLTLEFSDLLNLSDPGFTFSELLYEDLRTVLN